MKILVAMSGGVDSSVAAALLKNEGHEVVGATMSLTPDGNGPDIDSARRVADSVGIKHIVLDVSGLFESSVIENFCREYARGRTPNPCVLCNRTIKFGAMLDMALEKGFDKIATGHFARTARAWDGGTLLLAGADGSKDQSYFLSRLTRSQLEGALFPVGDLNKKRVREIASEMGLPAAERPESQEICFIPDGGHAEFVNCFLKREPRPGPIVSASGQVLGEHGDIINYTVGQRRGLGIPAGKPLYITGIDAAQNAIIVGEADDALSDDLTASDMNWLMPDVPDMPFRARVKIRHRAVPAEAVVTPMNDNTIYIEFNRPQKAVTPGQTVAVYRRDTVIGGAIIEKQGR